MILVQSHTEKLISSVVNNPVHGVLLTGPEGAGKLYLAKYLSAQLLNCNTKLLENYPYFKIINPDKGSISIDAIRDLTKYLQLKTTGKASIRRVVIIQDAHTMTLEAQNALLKSLEEPPKDTVIILTALSAMKLLGTIISRVREIAILPVEESVILKTCRERYKVNEVRKAFLLCGGYMGLLSAILQDDEHKLAKAVKESKAILSSSTYERLLKIEDIIKQKDLIPLYLYSFRLIASTALSGALEKNNQNQADKWFQAYKLFYEAESNFKYNPNSKLLLTSVFISL